MFERALQTDGLPPRERLARWHALVWNAYAPTDWAADQADCFQVEERTLELGDVQVWDAAFSPSRLTRTAKSIRLSDPEKYGITITRRGTSLGDTAGRRVVCEAGDLHFHDTSHPREVQFRAETEHEPYHATSVVVPKASLPLAEGRIEQLVGTRIRSGDGVGTLLSAFVTQLTTNTGAFRQADGSRLGLVAVDLVAAMFADVLDDLDRLPVTSRKNVLALRVKAFILDNLRDPDLTPAEIAAANHISVSYLHRIFQHEESTVSGWIRQRRLDRARDDLADPAQLSTPIHAIAARWGFPRAADFTRTFRNAIGVPPAEYRHQARPVASSRRIAKRLWIQR
jgi:AraC-like DNA-binding protein